MVTLIAFCHRDDRPDEAFSYQKDFSGIALLPDFLKDLFQGKENHWEGSISLAGNDLLHEEWTGSSLFIKGNDIQERKAHAPSIFLPSSDFLSQLKEFEEGYSLSQVQKDLLKKCLTRVFGEYNVRSSFLCLDLSEAEQAPLLLFAIEKVFSKENYPDFDLFLILPEQLRFLLEEKEPKAQEPAPAELPTASDAFLTFLYDLVGEEKATPGHLKKAPRPAEKKAKPEEKVSPKEEEAPKPAPVEPKKEKEEAIAPEKEDKRAEEKPESVKPSKGKKEKKEVDPKKSALSDARWNVFFCAYFAAMSLADPYLFFCFTTNSASTYFIIYLILQIFFLIMGILPGSYLFQAKKQIPKHFHYLALFMAPAISLVGGIIFLFVAKKLAWAKSEYLVFFALNVAYPLIYGFGLWLSTKIKKHGD